MTGSALHCHVIQPNVRDMKASEDTIWSRLPGDAQQYGLALEGFLPFSGPCRLSNQVCDLEAFAAAPDSRAGIKGQFFPSLDLPVAACLWFSAGDDHAFFILDLHFLKLPDHAFVQAVTGFVFEE